MAHVIGKFRFCWIQRLNVAPSHSLLLLPYLYDLLFLQTGISPDLSPASGKDGFPDPIASN